MVLVSTTCDVCVYACECVQVVRDGKAGGHQLHHTAQLHVCMRVCMRVCVCVYVCARVCVYIHMRVCIVGFKVSITNGVYWHTPGPASRHTNKMLGRY
jgi:hypothetical protein